MGGINVLMVLWITFLILTKSSDDSFYVEVVISEKMKEQDCTELNYDDSFYVQVVVSEKIEEQDCEENWQQEEDWEEDWEQEKDWQEDWEEISRGENFYATLFADDIKAQSWEECRNKIFLSEDKQKLKEHQRTLKRKMALPNCVPNFFMPVLEPCTCIGSGKTIGEDEVGILYCFPQPNKFKAKINYEYKTISTPDEYEDNMVPNEELKSCAPNRESSVDEVCFCGTEKDKKKLQDDGNEGFVDLKHICVPLDENEKTHSFSLLTTPHQKLPYCYRDQCHRNPHIIERNLIGHILHLASVGRTLLKYFSLIDRVHLAGIDRYTRLEIQRLISADGDDIARMLLHRDKRILCIVQLFETYNIHPELKCKFFSCTDDIQTFAIKKSIFSSEPKLPSFFSLPESTSEYMSTLPNFQITLRNPEINRFFPIFSTLKFSFKLVNTADKYLNVGIKKVKKFGKIIFYTCSKVSDTYFDQKDIEFQNTCRPADFSIKFYPEAKFIYFEGESYYFRYIWFEAKASTNESTIRFNADLYKFFSLIKNKFIL